MNKVNLFIKDTDIQSSKHNIFEALKYVRNFSYTLSKPLVTEDYVIQSMPDVSPTKWHLAHTTWFFETFILFKYLKDYNPINSRYSYLFNSYYIQAGERFIRGQRGLLSRPTVKEVFEYRKYVNNHMEKLLNNCDEETFNELTPLIEIGINHEQQHQELLLTDIKHVFSINPLYPVYAESLPSIVKSVPKIEWVEFDGGVFEIGYTGEGFAYDNESPRHKKFLNPFYVGSRLVTNGEYIEFIEDGGYKKAELWLSDGWATVEKELWDSPLYWIKKDGEWWNFTLTGKCKVDPNKPVCHISHYEADAFARWAGSRLPTETEWEVASAGLPIEGNFVDNKNFHPIATPENTNGVKLKQMFGDVWEWTSSAYLPYPGYKTLPGALGEYNGKFMSNQMVLRGGSCATSKSHIRKTYRNFFPPHSRWQFMGVRLAKDV
jgi:ergothioneine biosynthesis protein EgtB